MLNDQQLNGPKDSGKWENAWRSNFPAFGVNVNVNDIIASLHLLYFFFAMDWVSTPQVEAKMENS